MKVVVVLSTVDLGWLLIKDIISPPEVLLDIKVVSGFTLIGIAAIIVTLSFGYYLLMKKPATDC